MRILFIGICQLNAVCEILKKVPEFTNIFNNIHCYTIFNISLNELENIYLNILPLCQVVISQPVSSNYKNNEKYSSVYLRNLCIKLGINHYIMSNCFFTGYDPLPFQSFDDKGSTIFKNGISYLPALSIESLRNNDVIKACKDWNNLNAYPKKALIKNFNNTYEELCSRENKVFDTDFEVDIKISDYIRDFYQKILLFNTYNHPTNELLFELCRRIMKILNINNFTFPILEEELLGDYVIPPSPSVYYGLNFDFEYPHFVISKIKKTTHQAMILFKDCVIDDPNYNLWIEKINYNRKLAEI